MQTQEVDKKNNQIISSMSGFTSDFFGAFETTLTDNSMNNSKCDLSQSNANKSQLIRQIREDSVLKISEFLQKIINFHVFDQIFIFGVKKKRKQDKTPLNLHKHFYKIQLLFNMKNRSKQQWAFHRLIKFTQQFDIKQIFPSNSLEQNENRDEQNTEKQRIVNNEQILKVPKNEGNFSSKDITKQKTYQVVIKGVDHVNAEKLLLALENICGDSKQTEYAFNCIKQYEYYLTKKSYLIQMLIFFRKNQLRFAFLKLINLERQKNFKKQKSVIKTQQMEDSKDSMPISKPTLIQKKTPQSYGLEDKIKFKRIEKVASKGSILSENTQTRSNGGSQQKGHTKRSKSGLKFNKVNRKKTESPQKKEQRNQNQLTTKTEQKPLQQIKRLKREGSCNSFASAKQFKHTTLKSLAIQTFLQRQKPLLRLCNFHQFNSIVKSYYLPSHQLKRQVPDQQDQDIEAQRLGLLQQSRLKQSSFSNKQQFFTSSKRLQKLDDKKPLQFSNKKKNRLSNNKSKSKKSLQKSDEQAETVNIQSLKSYYFPEQQHFGKAIATNYQKVQSTKYIGGEKWEGKSKKKRITTEAQIRNVKSNEKNPYLNELREKIVRKPSERVISLSKMVERSISGRSNSKTSKTSKQDQKKTEKQQNLITTTQNYKQITARHASPQQKLDGESTKTPPAQVPRQWYFTSNNPSVMTSPLKSNQSPSYKAILQFQKATSNNRKV